MGVLGEGRSEQERQYSSSQPHPVTTAFWLCCCCSGLLLLLLCGRVIWASFTLSYELHNPEGVTGYWTGSNLNIQEVKTEYLGASGSVRRSRPVTSLVLSKAMRATGLPEGEQYMWYSPHEGFSNQARELMNALKIAYLLNRTLILPPVLDHFEVEQGTCLGPLRDQVELRKLSWTAIISRFTSSSPRDYVAIADIIDLSSIQSTVKTIDFRVFLALWCGIDISPACFGKYCRYLAGHLRPRPWGSLSSCAIQFFSTPHDYTGSDLIHEVHDDCRTTTWTHEESPSEKIKLELLLMEQLRNDTTLPSDVNANSVNIKRKDVIETLGAASPAGGSFLLMFGTLFSRAYKGRTLMVDITPHSPQKSTATTLAAIERQKFSEQILDAGQYFVMDTIKEPFFCAHVRLQDGVFLHGQEDRIFTPLRLRLEQLEMMSDQPTSRPLNVFVMTDLPREKWRGTYLYDLDVNPNYTIHTLDKEEDLLMDVSQKIHFTEQGLRSGFLPHQRGLRQWRDLRSDGSSKDVDGKQELFKEEDPSKFRLFLEEVVCSCATLGFQGTLRSTISRNILKMREDQMCPISPS